MITFQIPLILFIYLSIFVSYSSCSSYVYAHSKVVVGRVMSFSKPIGEPPPVVYQSDPRKLGSGCKKYMAQRISSDSFKETNTMALAPLSFKELDQEISNYSCSSHNKACSQGRGGCFGKNFYSDTEVGSQLHKR